MSGGGDSNDIYFPVLGCFVTLLLGVLTRQALGTAPFIKNLKLPYTAIVLLWGIVFGAIVRTQGTSDMLLKSMDQWESIDPHLILFVFLPALIFDSAFSMDWHTFKKRVWGCLLLAGPGLLMSCVFVAVLSVYAMPYDWDWGVGLMFGAVLSATDPVSVVALLHEIGTLEALGVIIEGEALLNDGTALVMFEITKQAVIDGSPGTVGNIIGSFCRLSIGGPIAGAVIAFATILWLGQISNDEASEITLTVACCYMSMFVAEGTALHVSGVLATVVAGLCFASVGKTSISRRVEGYLHHFWGMLEYTANTLIFMVSGLIIAAKTFFSENTLITAKDWGWLFVLYIYLHVTRLFIVWVCSFFMRKCGTNLTTHEVFAVAFSGLRGAVGLTLALIIEQEAGIPDDVRERVLFHTAGIAMLTLFVNGTSMRKVLKMLHLGEEAPAKKRLFRIAIERLASNIDKEFSALKLSKALKAADWETVESYLAISQDTPQDESRSRIPSHKDLSYEARIRFFMSLKAAYLHAFDEGRVNARPYRVLLDSIDSSLHELSDCDETEEDDEQDWVFIKQHCKLPPWLKLADIFPEIIAKFLRTAVFGHLAESYTLASAFVDGHKEVENHFKRHLETTQQEDNCLSISLNAFDSIQALVNASVRVRSTAISFMRSIDQTFPEVGRSVKTKVATSLLIKQRQIGIDALYKSGEVDKLEWTKLQKLVEMAEKRLSVKPPRLQLPTEREMLRRVTFLSTISKAEFDSDVWGKMTSTKSIFLEEGDHLVRQGDERNGIFVITRGVAKIVVHSDGSEDHVLDHFHEGDMVGELEHIMQCKYMADVTATTKLQAFRLDGDLVDHLMHKFPSVAEHLWKSTATVMVASRVELQNLLSESLKASYTTKVLHDWVDNASVVKMKQDSTCTMDAPAILLKGMAVRCAGEVFRDFDFVKPHEQAMTTTNDSIFLKFAMSRDAKATNVVPQIMHKQHGLERTYSRRTSVAMPYHTRPSIGNTAVLPQRRRSFKVSNKLKVHLVTGESDTMPPAPSSSDDLGNESLNSQEGDNEPSEGEHRRHSIDAGDLREITPLRGAQEERSGQSDTIAPMAAQGNNASNSEFWQSESSAGAEPDSLRLPDQLLNSESKRAHSSFAAASPDVQGHPSVKFKLPGQEQATEEQVVVEDEEDDTHRAAMAGPLPTLPRLGAMHNFLDSSPNRRLATIQDSSPMNSSSNLRHVDWDEEPSTSVRKGAPVRSNDTYSTTMGLPPLGASKFSKHASSQEIASASSFQRQKQPNSHGAIPPLPINKVDVTAPAKSPRRPIASPRRPVTDFTSYSWQTSPRGSTVTHPSPRRSSSSGSAAANHSVFQQIQSNGMTGAAVNAHRPEMGNLPYSRPNLESKYFDESKQSHPAAPRAPGPVAGGPVRRAHAYAPNQSHRSGAESESGAEDWAESDTGEGAGRQTPHGSFLSIGESIRRAGSPVLDGLAGHHPLGQVNGAAQDRFSPAISISSERGHATSAAARAAEAARSARAAVESVLKGTSSLQGSAWTGVSSTQPSSRSRQNGHASSTSSSHAHFHLRKDESWGSDDESIDSSWARN